MQEYRKTLRLSRLPPLETRLRTQKLSIQTRCASQVPAPVCLLEAFVHRSKQSACLGFKMQYCKVKLTSLWTHWRFSIVRGLCWHYNSSSVNVRKSVQYVQYCVCMHVSVWVTEACFLLPWHGQGALQQNWLYKPPVYHRSHTHRCIRSMCSSYSPLPFVLF